MTTSHASVILKLLNTNGYDISKERVAYASLGLAIKVSDRIFWFMKEWPSLHLDRESGISGKEEAVWLFDRMPKDQEGMIPVIEN